MRKIAAILSTAVLLGSLSVGSASAFDDLDAAQREPILALKERGIVSGLDDKHFVPQGKISYAQSVVLLVKGLGLNIDNMRFIKQPLASDYYTQIPDDAWYAQAFLIAQLNGLQIPKDVNPNSMVTREQFADLLIHALDTKGTFPIVKMLVVFADQDQIDPQLNYSLQRIVLHKIAELDKDRKFYPKREITRGEAAVWVHNTIRFIEAYAPKPPVQEEIKLNIEKVNDKVNKVILTRGQKPSAGYEIEITGIRFTEDGKAFISYTLTDPKPGSFNAAVITEPQAETYVPAEYAPVLEPK